VFVIALPLIYAARSFPMPAFCKYICPSGTLLGAGGLLSNEHNSSMFSMLGPLFTWKFCLLVIFIVGAVFIYRFFCRFFCPLGAIYGLFNRIAVLGIKLEKPKCVDCGLCVGTCEMDIRQVGDHECISCGKCVNVCPTGAITYKGPKILLAPNEVGGRPNAAVLNKIDPVDAPGTPLPKKTKIARAVVGLSMLAVLCGALVYYNLIDQDPAPVIPNQSQSDSTQEATGDTPAVGGKIGDLCYDYDLKIYGDAVSKVFSNQIVANVLCVVCCIVFIIVFVAVSKAYEKLSVAEEEERKKLLALRKTTKDIYKSDGYGIDSIEDDFILNEDKAKC
jgi:ferredoxin